MKDLSLGLGFCGGYTTELEYVSGPRADAAFPEGADLSFYNQEFAGDPVVTLVGAA